MTSMTLRPAPYPPNTDVFKDLDGVIRDFVLHGYTPDDTLADPEAIVVTQGSCFARSGANGPTTRSTRRRSSVSSGSLTLRRERVADGLDRQRSA